MTATGLDLYCSLLVYKHLSITLKMLNLPKCNLGSQDYPLFEKKNHIDIIPPIKQYILACEEVDNLQEMYKMLYPSLNIIHIPRVCLKLQKLCICGNSYLQHRATHIVIHVFQQYGSLHQPLIYITRTAQIEELDTFNIC